MTATDRLLALADRGARMAAGLDPILPLLARFVFAAVLLPYYWASAGTKIGEGFLGVLSPSVGAYAQIFPRAFEAVGYDPSKLGSLHWAVATLGTWAEFLLPLAIALGLFTRLAAIGMIGFVTVQSLTDLYGHGGIAQPDTLGAWFDGRPDGLILDQRAFWIFVLVVLVVKGGGALSLDRVVRSALSARPASPRPAP